MAIEGRVKYFMTENQQIVPLTDSDRKSLELKLVQRKADFRREVIITLVVLVIAPYLSHPGQNPLVESMTYLQALGFFTIILIPFLILSFYKLNSVIVALRTGNKRLIITNIIDIKKSQIFKRGYCLFKVKDQSLKSFYLRKYDLGDFSIGDFVKVEISEFGKEIIRVVRLTQD